MKFEIKSRWNCEVLFSLETQSLKLCIEAAVNSRADLRGANLYGADLCSANLYDANLYGADLRGANLYGAFIQGHKLKMTPIQINPIGSRNDSLFIFNTEDGIFVKTGCFFGSDEEFLKAVAKKHQDNKHSKQYQNAIMLAKISFEE